MTFEEFNSKYNNLVYAPLDINPPDIDISQFIDWSKKNKKSLIYDVYVDSMKKYKPTDQIYDQDTWLDRDKHNFWESYYIFFNNQWNKNFYKAYPELVSFFHNLPMEYIGTTGYLIQTKNQLHSSPIHTDEQRGLGLRITYSEDTSGLFFHKFKEGYTKHNSFHNFMERKDTNIDPFDDYGSFLTKQGHYLINKEVLDENPIYTNPPNKKKQAFIMTNELAPHGVIKRNSASVTFACFGKNNHEVRFKWNELDKLLEDSKRNNPNSFIYI